MLAVEWAKEEKHGHFVRLNRPISAWRADLGLLSLHQRNSTNSAHLIPKFTHIAAIAAALFCSQKFNGHTVLPFHLIRQ
jgi:hypothetical protein